MESLQRRLHASEKKLFSKELESEEKVTQSISRDAAPSEAPLHPPPPPSPCSDLHTLRLSHVPIVCQLQVEHRHITIAAAYRRGSYVKPPHPPSRTPQKQNIVSVQTTAAVAAH